jgi:predicted dehydrogenase
LIFKLIAMKKGSNITTRREFIAKAGIATAGITVGATTLSAAGYGRVMGANEKIRTGFIGVGNRGSQVLKLFMAEPDCEVAALCDVYEPYLNRDYSKVEPRYVQKLANLVPKMDETFPNKVVRYSDYRRMLDDKNIDAVCIATPDHWHAIMTIEAIKAGKDVFVEKPLAKTVFEGRSMINAWKMSKQVVTVGLSRRGTNAFHKLAKEIPAGKIGKVTFANGGYASNMYPGGIGKMKPEEPPKDFNWDMWLGPKSFRPYQYNIAPYMFRWWEEYDNQIANQGVHFLDLFRWLLNEKAPVAITTLGGKKVLDDDRTIPDTMHTIFEFPSGTILTYSTLEASSGGSMPYGMLEFRGTKGILYAQASGAYKVDPTQRGQFQTWDKLMEAEEFKIESAGKGRLADGSYEEPTANLVRNFLDCIKSRKTTLCSLEDGHLSTNMAHLATISMQVNQRLQWDPEKEIVTNSEAANKLLHYEYRKPWKL